MNCRDSESLILAERDGGLNKAQLAALSDHVAACPACHQFRTRVATAVSTYKAGVAAIKVPDADEAWRDLQARLHRAEGKVARQRPLAPIIWFSAPLAAAAAIAIAFYSAPTSGSKLPAPGSEPSAEVAFSAPPYDPSTIAGADFVEAGDPNASTMVYVDKESGWLVVWATDVDTKTSG